MSWQFEKVSFSTHSSLHKMLPEQDYNYPNCHCKRRKQNPRIRMQKNWEQSWLSLKTYKGTFIKVADTQTQTSSPHTVVEQTFS